METNEFGQYIVSSDDLIEILLQGKNINCTTVVEDEEISLYNKYKHELLKSNIVLNDPQENNISFDEFHLNKSSIWNIPDNYKTINVHEWLLHKCQSDVEIDRVNEEYALFEKYDLIMLLRVFIFLVDYMRKNKFIWGVGRGSSVSSFCLYLIGIHRVNSLKYGFKIQDYLK